MCRGGRDGYGVSALGRDESINQSAHPKITQVSRHVDHDTNPNDSCPVSAILYQVLRNVLRIYFNSSPIICTPYCTDLICRGRPRRARASRRAAERHRRVVRRAVPARGTAVCVCVWMSRTILSFLFVVCTFVWPYMYSRWFRREETLYFEPLLVLVFLFVLWPRFSH